MGRGDQCEVADRTISGKFAELALTARTEVTAKLQCLMAVQGPASANRIKIDSQAQSTRRRGTGIRPSFAAGIPSEREMPLPSRRWPEAGYVRIRVRGSALRSEPRDNCLGRERGKFRKYVYSKNSRRPLYLRSLRRASDTRTAPRSFRLLTPE
jgi:hypothetical protein